MISNKIKTALMALTMAAAAQTLLAQSAGTTISGQVYDSEGPLMLVNVVELDATNRIVAHAVTDINGNFAFKIKDPRDHLMIAYVGYKKRTLAIKGTYYKVRLDDVTQMNSVIITGAKKRQSTGLIIPERELSVAAQEIDAKEFEGLGITTVDEALQGRIAGLDIVANSGDLGAGTSMRLRGVSTINGNANPLIVVDGNVFVTDVSNFDFNNANDERFAELLNVNPEDISKISVLKDAAATAIWGSQGANGVIEITTKRGARGKTRVTYSYRFTGTHQPTGIKLLDGRAYTMLLQEEYFNPTLSDVAADIKELKYVRNDPTYTEYYNFAQNTDWRKEVSQFGALHKHYVSMSGGGDKANFRIALGYDKQSGTVIAQKLDRFTTRVALDYFVSDRIKFVTNFSMTYTKNKRNSGGLLGIAYQKMPNMSVWEYDQQGNLTGNYYNMQKNSSSDLSDQRGLVNPVALAYLAKNHQTSYSISPEFNLNYKLLGIQDDKTQLNYEGRINFNVFNDYSDEFYPADLVTAGWSDSKTNSASSSSSKSLGITTTHTLTFVPRFANRDHSFMAMIRGQLGNNTSKSHSDSEHGLPSGGIETPSAHGLISSFSTGSGRSHSLYFTFSAHYAYKGKYIADFSVRRDGSTRFGPDKRWGNFPALSFRWNVTDEKFMKPLKWLTMLSIRPGWGIVGGQPGGEGLFYSKYTSGESYNSTPSIYPSNIRMSKLKWEEKTTWNIGFNLGFFNDRITGEVNLYSQTTKDLLMGGTSIPTSSGFSSLPYSNVGKMRNNGWEVYLNTNRLINIHKFGIDMNINFANNINEIISMEPTVLASIQHEFDGSNGSYLSRVQLKHSFGSIYGFKYKGVYQYSDYSDNEVKGVSGPNAPVFRNANGEVVKDNNGRTIPMMFEYGSTNYEFKGGDAMYEDINHDGNINELDIVYLGRSLPKINGGFGLKFYFGKFTLNNQFNFRAGNKIINHARMEAENMYTNKNQSLATTWRWRVEGDKTEIPRALYQAGYNWLGSDRFVEDGSYLRLNYTQLSYQLDSRIVKKWGLNRVSLYLSLNNLFCLTGYSGADPDVGYGGYGISSDGAQTPRAKSFTGGVTVDF
jgi:TonB-linked SusC/RagA family outer membrane protein